MTNTSATGGYLVPTSSAALPGGLTLNQFIHNVLVGISGLDNTLVRPSWQIEPPKYPAIDVNWMAFGINTITPDANAFVQINNDGSESFQRHEMLEIGLSFYGPELIYYSSLVRDGFQITQNLEALRAANMGFTGVGPQQQVPDLLNERWVNRMTMSLFIRRQIQRVYPVLALVSANGTIHTVLSNGDDYNLNFLAEEEI